MVFVYGKVDGKNECRQQKEIKMHEKIKFTRPGNKSNISAGTVIKRFHFPLQLRN